MLLNAPTPSVGETWLGEFGSASPLGPVTVEFTFNSDTSLTFLGTGGSIEGRTETMDYTAAKIRDGLYMVCWTELGSDSRVTLIADFENGTAAASSAMGDDFFQAAGTFVLVR